MARPPAPTSPIRDAVYAAIVSYKREHDGNSPTYQELMAATGLTTTSLVSYHLRRLVNDGKIRLLDGSRGIVVVGGEWRMQ